MIKQQKGQAILEVVLAMSVVVIVILALVIVGTISLKNASFSRNQSLVTKYAQGGMETVRAYRDKNNWEKFTNDCRSIFALESYSVPSPLNLSAPDCYVPGSNPKIACSAAVAPADDRCEVEIVVYWTDSRGDNHSSALKTIFTNWR